MKNYLRLTSVMMKNESMDSPVDRRKRILVTILGLIAVVCIFIPACVLVGAIAFIMTTAVVAAGGDVQGLAFILMFVSGFSVVFGMSVILSVFYFSNDMNYLLPFPLRPWEIIASKFTVAFINESVMEFMIILSAMIGYMAATKFTLAGILVSVFTMITVPILPLVYCAVISVVLMTFTGLIKNKDSVHKIMGLATVLFIAIAFYSVSMVGGLNIDNYAVSLANGHNALYNVLAVVFIHVKLICEGMTGNVAAVAGYILVNVVAIAIFLVLAQLFYFKGVVGLGSAGKSSYVAVEELVRKGRAGKKGKMRAYFVKEMKVLFRTPAFLLNCVLINFLWPLMVYAVYMLQGSSTLFRTLLKYYRLGNEKMHVFVPVFVITVSILVTAANALASSAVTREGAGFVFMKYVPMSVRQQLMVKALVSIVISQTCLTLYIVTGAVWLKIDAGLTVFYLLLSLLGVMFVTFLGIALDTVNPKLLWDDEINALRGNSTVFFSMAYAMILGALLVATAYFFIEFTRLSVVAINVLITLLMVIIDVVAMLNCLNMGPENLEQ